MLHAIDREIEASELELDAVLQARHLMKKVKAIVAWKKPEINRIPLDNDVDLSPTVYSILVGKSTMVIQKNGVEIRSTLLNAEYTRYRKVYLHTHACKADTSVKDTATAVESAHMHYAELTGGLCRATPNRLTLGFGRTEHANSADAAYVEYVLEFETDDPEGRT